MARTLAALFIAVCLIAVCLMGASDHARAGANKIVSAETVRLDSTVKEIKIVTPDEQQRLQDDTKKEIDALRKEIAVLTERIVQLEKKVNQ
jgi:TolA-binding protein